MPASKEKQIDLFVAHTVKPQYHGCFQMRGYTLIGLPTNFQWKSEEDFMNFKEESKISFPWGDPAAKDMKAALLMPDDEKRFLLARQLGYVDSNHVWAALGIPMSIYIVGFMSGYALNVKLGNFEHNVRRRPGKPYIIFGAIAVVGFCLNLVVKDSYQCLLDKGADRYAALMGPDVCMAGYNYYNKQMNANIAARKMVPGFEEKITALGNEKTGIFRVKNLPLNSRRNYMKQMHDKLIEKAKKAESEQSQSQESAV